MKKRTFKKNNTPIKITKKSNNTNKKIKQKTNKINKKKLLVGGNNNNNNNNNDFYNENFFSLELTDFKRPMLEKDEFPYQFMEKYINNLNPETEIPNENIYKTYRKDYEKKNISKTKKQNLKEIRLNYYLKTVISIMKNENKKFNHSQINYVYKPIDLYNEINGIKDNYDKSVKSKLEITNDKNAYYINCHGGYSEEDVKLFTVPENVMIHFITPLNYIATDKVNSDSEIKINKIQEYVNSKNQTINDIKKLLKINCFQNIITFLPDQKCFDINLSIDINEEFFKDEMGIYKISKNNKNRDYLNLNIQLSNLIYNVNSINSNYKKLEFSDNVITNVFIDCCRSCNNNINDNLTIETMYIYENFIKQINHLLLEILPYQINDNNKNCKTSYNKKLYLENNQNNNSELGMNTYLSSKKLKFNKKVQGLIRAINNQKITDKEKDKIKKSINDELLEYTEIKDIIIYFGGGNKDLNLMMKIMDYVEEDDRKKDLLSNMLLLSTKLKYNEIVFKILKSKKDININIKDQQGNAALHYAINTVNSLVIMELIEHTEIDLNLQNKNKETPLHLMITEQKDMLNTVLTFILKFYINKININIKDNFNNSILNYAIMVNRVDEKNKIIETILENKDKFKEPIDLTILDKDNNTPLHKAVIKTPNNRVVFMLLDHIIEKSNKAEKEKREKGLYKDLSLKERSLLLKKRNKNTDNISKLTNEIKDLNDKINQIDTTYKIKNSNNINIMDIKNNNGNTILHEAIKNNSYESLKIITNMSSILNFIDLKIKDNNDYNYEEIINKNLISKEKEHEEIKNKLLEEYKTRTPTYNSNNSNSNNNEEN
jgi:ankyrin repeat protein